MSQVIATGGDSVFDITDGGVDYRVHVWTTVGSSDPFIVTQGGEVEYLVVAGGGGGGQGGAGAGEVKEGTTTVTASTFSVVVGGGGMGSPSGSNPNGSTGSNSSALSQTCLGGGGGGGLDLAGSNGGSGGGGGRRAAAAGGAAVGTGLGNAGGSAKTGGSSGHGSGGGGGAATAGGSGNTSNEGGAGGLGYASNITGTSVIYAGGGGGGQTDTVVVSNLGGLGGGGDGGVNDNGENGTDGLGGGGGGKVGTANTGGNGGSGVVIIRYVLFPPPPPVPYSPVTTVTIGGQDFTGDTVGLVSVTRGRDNVYADPTAGFASITLIDKTGVGFTIDPTQMLTITLDDSTGTPVPLFAGSITDISRALYDPGLTNTPAATVTVSAVGPLARLSRVQVLPAGRPAETDGERILAALEEGLGLTWESLDVTEWDAFDPAVEWADVGGGLDPSLIDTGLYDLIALPAQDGGHNALQVVSDASRSGQGILYERGDGLLAWDNADYRATTTTFYPLPAGLLIASNLSTFTALSDLVNAVEVTYDGGVASASDQSSIPVYGRWSRRIETLLVNQSNGEQFAAAWIARHAFPLTNFGRATIRIDGLEDTEADGILALDVNDPVDFIGLPVTFGALNSQGFIEGVEWRIDAYRAEVSFLVSDANLSTGDLRWAQIDPTDTWAGLDAMLEWQDWR
jgi:hypothetical protein